MLLELKDISVFYGKNQVVNQVELTVEEGEIVCLLGPNGAGKSTLAKTIMGFLKPASGTIAFDGLIINRLPTEARVKLGMSLVPEGKRLFPWMSVWENLDLGGYVHRKQKDIRRSMLKEIFALFPILEERKRQPAGTLSGGEQRMLEIALALMSRPRLAILDEPSLGLAPQIVENLFEVVKDINERGITILLVEQNAALAFEFSDRAYVLELGKIPLKGRSSELKEDERVRQAYLGI